VLGEPLDGEPHADRYIAYRFQQHAVQFSSTEREAWPDRCPEFGDVDLFEQSPAVILEALRRDLDCSGGDLRLESEDAQRPRGIAGKVDAGSGGSPDTFTLDQIERDVGVRQRARERQAGYPAADDQHASCISG
jgi:hypothetical protein